LSARSKERSPKTPEAPASPHRPAIKSRAAVATFVVLTAGALAGDLLSKHYVFKLLLEDPALRRGLARRLAASGGLSPKEALSGFQRPVGAGVKLSLSTNSGVVFGLSLPRWLVAVATVVTASLVAYFFATADARTRSVHVALALILGGALGNLYDRVLGEVAVPGVGSIRYEVRDFIDCADLYYPWVFNGADAWLVIGVVVLAGQWSLAACREKRSGATHRRPSR